MSKTYMTKQEKKAAAKFEKNHNNMSALQKDDIICAIYTRVSSEDQVNNYSLGFQEDECKKFIASKGWNPDKAILYQDAGIKGTTDDRPDFQKMVKDGEEGKFHVLVVHKLDRFMRNMILCPIYLRKFVKDYHIPTYMFGDNLIFENEVEMSIQLTMFCWFADYYIKNLSNEVSKGKKKKAEKGLSNGAAPFGYTKGEKGALVINDKEAQAVHAAFKAYSTGLYSDADIANLLNDMGFKTKRGHPFSKDSVTDLLQNIVYEGYIIYTGKRVEKDGSKRYPGTHTPIVSEELFKQCMEVRAKKNKNPKRVNQAGGNNVSDRFMLQGLLYCSNCGRKLRVQSRRDHKDSRYVESPSVKEDPCIFQKKGGIVISSIPEKQISDIIDSLEIPEEWISEIAKKYKDTNIIDENKKKLENAQKKMKRLKNDFDNFYDVYSDKELEANTAERQKLYEEIRTLETQLSTSDRNIDSSQILLKSFKDYFHRGTMRDKSDICHLLFQKIIFDFKEKRIIAFIPYTDFLNLFLVIADINKWTVDQDNIFHINK